MTPYYNGFKDGKACGYRKALIEAYENLKAYPEYKTEPRIFTALELALLSKIEEIKFDSNYEVDEEFDIHEALASARERERNDMLKFLISSGYIDGVGNEKMCMDYYNMRFDEWRRKWEDKD